MTESKDRFERFFDWVVTRASGRLISGLAILFYPGIGLMIPLVLGWSTPNLIWVNAFGVTMAMALLVGWLGARVEAARRRHLVEWTSDLRMLSAEEFEWFVGELFRRDEWLVQHVGGHGRPDGNIDLVITRANRRQLVQCKLWQSWLVGVDEIRRFAGTLLREGHHGPDGIFVTTSSFTEAARAEAKRTGIRLIDGRELYTLAEAAREPVPCPTCSSPMVLGRSPHGWWFRCTRNGCSGKKDLDRDPARAVDLLTQVPSRAPASGLPGGGMATHG